MDADPTRFAEVWAALPEVGLAGLEARWLGTTDHGELAWLRRRLSVEAYSHVLFSRWLEPFSGAPAMWTSDGDLDPLWVDAVREAARRLAAAESDACAPGLAWWTSWLLWELPDPHRHLAECFREPAERDLGRGQVG